MRLDKFISNAGYGSRSEIKKLIKRGDISVDSVICTDPSKKVNSNMRIEIYGKHLTSKPFGTIMMNKPKGYVSSNESEADYPSVIELIEPPHPKYAIAGRLDVDSTGLLILSTEGDIIHSIISPTKDITKTYQVVVKNFNPERTSLFHNGIKLSKDFLTKPVTFFDILEERKKIYTIQLGITEGKYHQVKRMFEAVDSQVIQLERVAIGSLCLDKTLSPGECRELSESEIQSIFT